MILRQYQAVAAGEKTLTQRIIDRSAHTLVGDYQGVTVTVHFDKPDLEYASETYIHVQPDVADCLENARLYKNARLTYKVGGVYTVTYKRGKPSVRVHRGTLAQTLAAPTTAAEAEQFAGFGWTPLKIEVTRIRFGLLQAMTDADVLMEGKPNRQAYIDLWNQINGKGAWDKNPLVARIHFKVWTGAPDSFYARTAVSTAIAEQRLAAATGLPAIAEQARTERRIR